ncbi:MAG TPA: MFS transporter [Rhodocyclaceae bacterium]|nr:MFS transporter [Rhodocyclaceae bacterium]
MNHSHPSPPGFSSRKDATEFWLLCLATFLCFTTLSQTALLSVVLADYGVPIQSIGLILSSYGVSVIAFSLASGPLANRLGMLGTLRLGMMLLIMAHLSYHFSIDSIIGAALSRLLQGAGFGLFLAAAMAFATSKLTSSRIVHLLGIYASMVQLPNALGPPIAQWYLKNYGHQHFFLVGAAPALLALILTLRMTDSEARTDARSRTSLLQAIRHPGLRRPLAAIFIVGTMLGLVSSYMAPILISKQIALACFFTVFPVTAFLSRFFLLAWIQAWPRHKTLGWGFAMMAMAYALITTIDHPIIIAATAVLFGLGSSVSYPILSAWVSEQFTHGNKASPIAVFNTLFNFGLFLTPLCGGYLIALGGYNFALLVLATGSFSMSLIISRPIRPEPA